MREPFHLTEPMRSKDPLTAALAYAEAGLRVLAIWGLDDSGACACGEDCGTPGKHPIGKFFKHAAHSATTDAALIRRVWKRYPSANVAIATDDRLLVVDIDADVGEDAVERLNLPKTIAVKTGRGHHLYFELAPGTRLLDRLPKVDLLSGEGHYAMAPPSRHASGANYRWLRGASDAAELSGIVGTAAKTARVNFGANGASFEKGSRNENLTSIAGSLRRRGLSSDLIEDALTAINDGACRPPLDHREVHRIAASVGRYETPSEELFGPPIQREALPMEWLWYPYIPRYGLTILAGDPGMGKSLLTALLLAIVTSSAPWPLLKERPTGNRVLLLSAEDNWARVTLHRLLKAGADIDNLHHMRKFRSLSDERLDALREHMRSWRPDLVVIDTISAYMGGGRDMHRQNEVGEFLALLTEMAEETGAAIVALAHLNKQGGEHPLYRIVGSIGFVASIRSALFFGTDPSNRERVALAHGKANQSEKGRTIIFEKIGGGRTDVPVLRPVSFSDADETDICRVEKKPVGRPGVEHEEGAAFVLQFLTDEPIPWRAIEEAADRRSIASPGTLNIVRAELAKAGRIVQVGRGPKARWKLGDVPVEDDD